MNRKRRSDIELHLLMNEMIVCMYRGKDVPDFRGRMKKIDQAGQIKAIRFWVKIQK